MYYFKKLALYKFEVKHIPCVSESNSILIQWPIYGILYAFSWINPELMYDTYSRVTWIVSATTVVNYLQFWQVYLSKETEKNQ